MDVTIGVDSHKSSLAAAAIDELGSWVVATEPLRSGEVSTAAVGRREGLYVRTGPEGSSRPRPRAREWFWELVAVLCAAARSSMTSR